MALPTRLFVRTILGQKLTLLNSVRQRLTFPTVVSGSANVGDAVRRAIQSRAFTMRLFSTTNGSSCEHRETSSDTEGEDKKSPTIKLRSRNKPYTFHPVEVSIRYMESPQYSEVYGNDPVWTNYRRNFKGQYAPPKTRRSCIIFAPDPYTNTGNPCPICRDEYLVVHYENTKLLKQFISPYTGVVLEPKRTGVCRRVQFNLELEIMKAYDLGLIEFDVPFRAFDYSRYYPQLKEGLEAQII
ncbi:28S ribosomal protein S18b, mitochondrial-like [Varroa destructor]|uniref:Small ribosomal subunit protein mS40 n=1 Tax=Varroa destructor TaxID=109461 RepID=A0A7M7KM38_VARDE|nr:28S ribosomal protein S18b, mitochondrial-like [Varroa destructor]